MRLRGKATVGFAPLASLCAALIFGCGCLAASPAREALADDAVGSGNASAYTVTIPADLSVPVDLNVSKKQTGSMAITGTLGTNSTLTVAATHQDVLTSGEGATIPYELDGGNFVVRSHDEQLSFSQTVTATVTQDPVCAGTYTDTVAFTISCQANEASLVFDPQGGEVGTTSKALAAGDAYGELPTPARAGYDFIGWYTDPVGGNKVGSNTTMEGTYATVYAHWKSHELTINYHSGGAQEWQKYPNNERVDLEEGNVIMQSERVAYGENYDHPVWGLLNVSRAARTGYYSGEMWRIGSPNAEATVSDKDDYTGYQGKDVAWELGALQQLVKGDVTVDLYPVWVPNAYIVKYEGNGASGSTASSKHAYDVDAPLTANGFTKAGFAFAGWNTKQDGSGTSYADGQSVKNLTATRNIVTLYAQWMAVANDPDEAESNTVNVDESGSNEEKSVEASSSKADSSEVEEVSSNESASKNVTPISQ